MSVVMWGVTAWVLALPPERLLALDQVRTALRAVQLRWETRDAGAIDHRAWQQVEDQYAGVLPRLADAERRLHPSPVGRVAAARRWYVLARELELVQTARADRGMVWQADQQLARLGRLDAESELRQALATLPPGSPPVTAPFGTAPADFRAVVADEQQRDRGWVRFPATVGGVHQFDRLRAFRPGRPEPVAELVVVYGPQDGTAHALPLPGGEVRPGDELRP